jgi:hypothetical protein
LLIIAIFNYRPERISNRIKKIGFIFKKEKILLVAFKRDSPVTNEIDIEKEIIKKNELKKEENSKND